MDHKIQLIHQILTQHILNKNFHSAVFDVFKKEFDVDLFQTPEYQTEINLWTHTLTKRLTAYLDKVYSADEIEEMALNSNSPLYYRMITTEYKEICATETRVFSVDLRQKFDANGVHKKTFLHKVMQFFGLHK